ncbi:MAG TPA: AAA family ATPase, partial [Polyangiales bacterium]|nr:AAA family ATPase [Polyangiales bacterium]
LPIDGAVQGLLRRKLETEPTPIDQLVPGVPSALCRLCTALLQRRPELRPSGEEVLSVLRGTLSAADTASWRPEPNTAERTITRQHSVEPALVGRELEREQLRAALAEAQAGAFAAVHVSGVSGSGKSALIESVLDELESLEKHRARRPMVLRGRCYERENVAFKALDAVMDALITQLSREDDFEVSHVLPSAVAALTQLFPSLNRLSAVQRLVSPEQRTVAAPHAREEAEAALRDLFTRLATRRLVVVWIDDLHWGDLDSARILKSWLEPPHIPGMLLVLSYRSDEVATNPCLRLLTSEPAPRNVALGPLGDDFIRALCVQRFASAPQYEAVLNVILDRVVREAAGSPFLATQLAALALTELSDGQPEALGRLTIQALVARRTAQLDAPARRLLNVLSVASRPLPTKLALRLAAAVESGRAALHELASLGLIRTRESEGERLLAVYHDRLREGVLAGLRASERAQLDRELLHALEAEGGADPAWLHALALGAGQREAALRYGQLAAAQATATLAFEHAAALYRACLELAPEASSLELWQKLAVALAHAGHGRQAAAAYLEAARRAQGEHALQLERSAASHLLRSGRFEEGEALVNKVVAALRLDTPKSPAGLLSAIAWERTRLALRGMHFTPRRFEDIPASIRYGGELCGTLSVEIQPYDPLRAALLQARSLRIALDCGVPEFVARAFCVAATMAAVAGGSGGAERAQDLLDRASALARTFQSPLVDGNIASARAVCAMLLGRMQDVVLHSAEAERLFRQTNASDEGEYYHRFTVLAARISALFQLGQHQQARAELNRTVNEARATDNVSALLLLSTLRTRVEIADEQADKAVARLEAEGKQLPPQRFGLLNAYHLGSVMRVGCATRDHDWALTNIRQDWDRFRQSLYKRGGYFAVIAPALHARLLLNKARAERRSAAEATALIAGDLRMLESVKGYGAEGAVARTRARLLIFAGDRAGAREQLQRSIRCFDKPDSLDEAARDRYAYGALLGTAEGAALQAAAVELLCKYGYANPQRDIASYYPELFG